MGEIWREQNDPLPAPFEGVEIKDALNETVVRQGVTAEEARQVLKDKGRLSSAEMVRLRGRYSHPPAAKISRE
ncbi:MAG TPA: hypothetical protein DIT64_19005 [Verrucomicrobiales bacterium]|nr:hypothetical protein [Verrucomicrobiales bacterium]HCN79208.1 hypothetical protein [Verrucomicrobiales bacterium]HRJ10260.1 hypothetical protein [Prosthecobacter sp.]HRK16504.1 hypothetical protein [Prosthecobacter sp.]